MRDTYVSTVLKGLNRPAPVLDILRSIRQAGVHTWECTLMRPFSRWCTTWREKIPCSRWESADSSSPFYSHPPFLRPESFRSSTFLTRRVWCDEWSCSVHESLFFGSTWFPNWQQSRPLMSIRWIPIALRSRGKHHSASLCSVRHLWKCMYK